MSYYYADYHHRQFDHPHPTHPDPAPTYRNQPPTYTAPDWQRHTQPLLDPDPFDSCVVCGLLTKKQCAGCKMVKYCSEACQKSHWTEHKTRCNRYPPPQPVLDQQPSTQRSSSCWSPTSHRRSAAPLIAAAAVPPPQAAISPPCSPDRINTLSTAPMPAVPPPQPAISPPCSPDMINTAVQRRGKSSTLNGEIESTNFVEAKPSLRVKTSQVKKDQIEHLLNRKTSMFVQELAKGTFYIDPLLTGWEPLLPIRGMSSKAWDAIRRPVLKLTGDFDFMAMNEKFKKDQVWGHMGESNRSQFKDKEGHGEAMDNRSTSLATDAQFDPSAQ